MGPASVKASRRARERSVRPKLPPQHIVISDSSDVEEAVALEGRGSSSASESEDGFEVIVRSRSTASLLSNNSLRRGKARALELPLEVSDSGEETDHTVDAQDEDRAKGGVSADDADSWEPETPTPPPSITSRTDRGLGSPSRGESVDHVDERAPSHASGSQRRLSPMSSHPFLNGGGGSRSSAGSGHSESDASMNTPERLSQAGGLPSAHHESLAMSLEPQEEKRRHAKDQEATILEANAETSRRAAEREAEDLAAAARAEEERLAAEAEAARRGAEAEAGRRAAEEEAQRKAEEEERLAAEAEAARRGAEAEAARRAAEEEAQRKAEEEERAMLENLQMLLQSNENDDDSAAGTDDESYEARRLRKLKANEEILAQLGLGGGGSKGLIEGQERSFLAESESAAPEGEDFDEAAGDMSTSEAIERRGRGRPAKASRAPRHGSTWANHAGKRTLKLAEDGTTTSLPLKGTSHEVAYVDLPALRSRQRLGFLFCIDDVRVRAPTPELVSESESSQESEAEDFIEEALPEASETPAKRGRGRPPKDKSAQPQKAAKPEKNVKPKRAVNVGDTWDGSLDMSEWTSCHQCRRKVSHTKARECTNKEEDRRCPMKFCFACMQIRYGVDQVSLKAADEFICPRCQGFCNCSLCLRKRGLEDLLAQQSGGRATSLSTMIGHHASVHHFLVALIGRELFGSPGLAKNQGMKGPKAAIAARVARAARDAKALSAKAIDPAAPPAKHSPESQGGRQDLKRAMLTYGKRDAVTTPDAKGDRSISAGAVSLTGRKLRRAEGSPSIAEQAADLFAEVDHDGKRVTIHHFKSPEGKWRQLYIRLLPLKAHLQALLRAEEEMDKQGEFESSDEDAPAEDAAAEPQRQGSGKSSKTKRGESSIHISSALITSKAKAKAQPRARPVEERNVWVKGAADVSDADTDLSDVISKNEAPAPSTKATSRKRKRSAIEDEDSDLSSAPSEPTQTRTSPQQSTLQFKVATAKAPSQPVLAADVPRFLPSPESVSSPSLFDSATGHHERFMPHPPAMHCRPPALDGLSFHDPLLGNAVSTFGNELPPPHVMQSGHQIGQIAPSYMEGPPPYLGYAEQLSSFYPRSFSRPPMPPSRRSNDLPLPLPPLPPVPPGSLPHELHPTTHASSPAFSSSVLPALSAPAHSHSAMQQPSPFQQHRQMRNEETLSPASFFPPPPPLTNPEPSHPSSSSSNGWFPRTTRSRGL
ncbi:ZINC-FINGER DOMAIN OF MONOAMINE-OXIDASE A REPRESSOR R1 PROTEIN [Ceraceosorus bombacis]|uniref:ZINC-FINGER DOMAIN OF MONOAMINE-OXIDASE A REPRESSOR R1 PROTEIN n=1 Tax=Ceraceosorus bombacis TaxID=401625 RepID=A0A0N7L9P0_9BASI|nr:ZINC-FINGER DOMAIN OF MONOAMINE-OXIDASE A REPRESSOR R1 PROTEIN [Ceraceosorus bombacis]